MSLLVSDSLRASLLKLGFPEFLPEVLFYGLRFHKPSGIPHTALSRIQVRAGRTEGAVIEIRYGVTPPYRFTAESFSIEAAEKWFAVAREEHARLDAQDKEKDDARAAFDSKRAEQEQIFADITGRLMGSRHSFFSKAPLPTLRPDGTIETVTFALEATGASVEEIAGKVNAAYASPKLRDALAVIVLNPATANALRQIDQKAYEQAVAALTAAKVDLSSISAGVVS